MFPFTIRMYLKTLFFALLFSLSYAEDREVVAVLNPGCEQCSNSVTLIYVKAKGRHDIIHQIWDFSNGMPTIIYALASLKSTLAVQWVINRPVGFAFSEQPSYSFAVAIDSIYEYEDCLDRGHIDDKCRQRQLSLDYVSWYLTKSALTSKEAMVRMHGVYKKHSTTGIVDIKLDLLPFYDYAVELPHLIHTSNSTLVDVSLVNFTTTYNSSRYAVHLTLVSTDKSTDSMIYILRKSLDDEHTPGVFEMMEIKTPKCYTSDAGGFMQFRPVGYSEARRSVSSSTIAYVSTLNRTTLYKTTTLRNFYGNYDRKNLLVQGVFISFGLPGDGYYKQHNFTSWSFTYGYGAPPVENVSLLVITVISIGLGVPLLLALSGITYVLVRRYNQRNYPARFTDDE